MQASGTWTGEPANCIPNSVRTIGLFVMGLILETLLVSLCIACCIFGKNFKVTLFIAYKWSFGQRLNIHDRLYDVFLVYNNDSHDERFVEDELMPLLRRYNISPITENCFTPGRDRFTCLENAMAQSASALVVITPEFLAENWKLYQLNQVICTNIEERNFKVVFLLCQKLETLEDLPENLRLFLRLGTAVKQYKKQWESMLIYELKHKTKQSLSKRLSFGRKTTKLKKANKVPDGNGGDTGVNNGATYVEVDRSFENHI